MAIDQNDPRTFLAECARRTCEEEPLLSTMGPNHIVELPQRALRQPKRRAGTPPPPLIRMLAAGRQSAEVRVRLYLWLWACLSTRGYTNLDLRRSTDDWAQLVNIVADDALSNPVNLTQARRRTIRAIDYLVSQRLVRWQRPDLLRLLDPDGSGADYIPWSSEYVRDRAREREGLGRFYADRIDLRRSRVWEDEPLKLPAGLWTNGTISTLSAAATVALLVLWDYETEPGELIIVPKSRAYEYPFSSSTWHKGCNQLEQAGVISRENGPLVFPATNANPKVESDRYRVRWRINHPALFG